MNNDDSKTLFLFIDESGNFDFSPKGTKYFILSGFVTFDPIVHREDLVRLRYGLLAGGVDQEYFHASEDKQDVRDKVYSILSAIGNSYEVHSIIARKNKTNPVLYKETYVKKGETIERITGMGLYKKLAECLLQYIFSGKEHMVSKIVVVLGALYVGEKKKVILKTLKHYLKNEFPGVVFEIFSHQTRADLNCQLADYCCWAIAIKAERDEDRPYKIIQSQVKSVFDIFERGERTYYDYNIKK